MGGVRTFGRRENVSFCTFESPVRGTDSNESEESRVLVVGFAGKRVVS